MGSVSFCKSIIVRPSSTSRLYRVPMADEVEAERQCMQEVRGRFFADNDENIGDFDESDLRRLRHDDLWLSCFVRARNQNVQKATEALVICLRWRKTFGLNELTERRIDRRLFEAGFLFYHNRDKDGNSIILFIGKNYKKDPQQHQELKRFLVFLLEKHVRMYPSRKVTLIFDMQETGLANMDMDFIKFIITCFTNYFPNTLAWLLVVELPWILTAAWKIVRTWLSPEAVNKIKFISKADVVEYVDKDQLLVKLGGTDSYEYAYPINQEDSGLGPPERDADSMCASDSSTNLTAQSEGEEKEEFLSMQLSFDESDSLVSRKVKFEEKVLTSNTSTNNTAMVNSVNRDDQPIKPNLKPGQPVVKTPTSPIHEHKHVTKLLNISPPDELVFGGPPNATGEILQILTLDNSSYSTVAFKVKTTSPESYRVRPSSGRISSNSFSDVSVFLQPGHEGNVGRDKFLVMSTEIKEGTTASETAAVWRTASKSSILEHRLRCSILTTSSTNPGDAQSLETFPDEYGNASTPTALADQLRMVDKKIDKIDRKISYVEEGLQLFIKVQLGLFSGMVILFAVVVYYTTYLV